MKHTPGPWEVEPATEAWFDNHVWTMGGREKGHHIVSTSNIANAQLIAAAPDMLEALELVMETYCLYIDFTRETDQMRKARTLVGYAIDKATKG